MNMKKPQYYLIGAGIVVLLGALVFVLVQSPSISTDDTNATSTATTTTDIFDMEPIIPEAKVSTEGWKTCRNEEYGWEIKYPGEWYVYGEGAYSEHTPILVRTTPCRGGGVLLSNFNYVDNKRESVQGVPQGSIRVRQYTAETGGVVKMSTHSIEEMVQHYAPGSLMGVVSLNDGKTKALLSTHAPGKYQYLMYVYGHWYEISTSDNLEEDYRNTILATLRFIDDVGNTLE
jgi:hypothetical protein